MRAPRLSLVIPAYNEEKRLPAFLREARDYLVAQFGESFEILVVDDGSRDATADVARREIGHSGLLRLEKNQGKGAAVRAGMLAARGELILFADADGATPMEEERRLREAIDGGADVAIGSRATGGQDREVLWHRFLIGRTFAWIVNTLAGIRFRDTQCGFKMFRRRCVAPLFTELTTRRFSFDVEILVRAEELGLRVNEIGVRWNEKAGSKVNLFIDPFRMFLEILQIRKAHRRRVRDKSSEPPMRAAS